MTPLSWRIESAAVGLVKRGKVEWIFQLQSIIVPLRGRDLTFSDLVTTRNRLGIRNKVICR